jgi:hypothetical protein
MDLEETEARNNSAGENQQLPNWPIDKNQESLCWWGPAAIKQSVSHCEAIPRIKAAHLLTALQDGVSNVQCRAPKGVSCEETIWAAEDWFGDQHLTAGYHDHLNKETQILGESLQEFATAIEWVTPCAFTSHDYHTHRWPGKAFVDDITDQGIKTSGRQQDTQQRPRVDPCAGRYDSWILHQAVENKWQALWSSLPPP